MIYYGMGISINKNIAACLGGDISFSLNKSRGVSFKFSFEAKLPNQEKVSNLSIFTIYQ